MARTKKTCGSCGHFSGEPGAIGRGCCWHSGDLDTYRVVGVSEKGCEDWVEKRSTNFERYFGNAAKVVHARVVTPHDSSQEVRVTWSGVPVYVERPAKIGWCERLETWLESEDE